MPEPTPDELLAFRQQPHGCLKFRNRCRRVSAFELHLAEIVVRVSIPWTELNSGAKFFESLLPLSLLIEYFPEGAMYIGNFWMQLLQRSQPLCARGDSPGSDHRLCVDILCLWSKVNLSDRGLQHLYATVIIPGHELANSQNGARANIIRVQPEVPR
jgi:hypothetical protein